MDCSLGQDGIAVVLCRAVHLDTVGAPYSAKQGLHRQACGYCGQVKLRSSHMLKPLAYHGPECAGRQALLRRICAILIIHVSVTFALIVSRNFDN